MKNKSMSGERDKKNMNTNAGNGMNKNPKETMEDEVSTESPRDSESDTEETTDEM